MTSFEDAFKGTAAEIGYSESEFYTRPKNEHDHGATKMVVFPPEVLSQASRIVESGKVFEYQSVSDVIRDAVVHRLHWLTENVLDDDDGWRILHEEIIETSQQNALAKIASKNKLLQNAVEVLDGYARYDTMELARQLDWHEDAVAGWPPVWQERMQEIVDGYRNEYGIKRYKPKLKAVQGEGEGEQEAEVTVLHPDGVGPDRDR